MTTKQQGDAAEDRALAHLRASGLRLVARNYRTPGRGGGEIDLILRVQPQPASKAARIHWMLPPSMLMTSKRQGGSTGSRMR